MPIKAVLFDADGVVIFPWRFAGYLRREHGITPEMTRNFFHGVFGDCLVGKADLGAVLPPYLQAWGWPGSVDEFIAVWLEVENAVDPRVVEVIHWLQNSGIRCCLATSQERNRTAYMRTVMGFDERFDALFFSCELGSQKPELAYYRAIAASLGLKGEEMLFWDDSPKNVEAARGLGWRAEVYTDFEVFLRTLAKYLANEGNVHA